MPVSAEARRRSSRRPKPKNYSSYNVGDVVEITRHNVSAAGRLAYKLSEGPTPNPRWLVTFDSIAWKDEELYERSFGKILEKAEEPDASPKASNGRRGARGRGNNNVKTTATRKNNRGDSGVSSASEDDDQISSKKKKAVSFSEGSVDGSDDSSPASTAGDGAANGKVSAREQRSRRRQAKIHEEASEMPPQGQKRGYFGKNGSNGSSGSNKRTRKNQEVVKIQMLTGTLYLYRGLYRRAEFVRRY